MSEVLPLILVWLLAGSIGLNINWIFLDKETMGDFEHWKNRKQKPIKTIHYIKGFLFGLLLGPFSVRDLSEKRSRNNKQD